MKTSRQSSKRRKAGLPSVSWDQHRILETEFLPVVVEDGSGPVIDRPEYDFVLIHGVAAINLRRMPGKRAGQLQVKVRLDTEFITRGFLVATRPQLASWLARRWIDVQDFWTSKALVFNRPIPPNFSMRQFTREFQAADAPIIADLRQLD